MLYYSIISSPIGKLCIVKSDIGVQRILFSNNIPFEQYLHNNFSQEKVVCDDSELKKAANHAQNIGLAVHAGHGLTYKSTLKIKSIKAISEFNIGHFIISESIFTGLKDSIVRFRKILKKPTPVLGSRTLNFNIWRNLKN